MKPKEYAVLRLAVEDGVKCGWARAHKHTEEPDERDILDAIEDAVITMICEWFEFEKEEEE